VRTSSLRRQPTIVVRGPRTTWPETAASPSWNPWTCRRGRRCRNPTDLAGGWVIQFSPDGPRFATSGGSDAGRSLDARTAAFLGSVRAEDGDITGFRTGHLIGAHRLPEPEGLPLGPAARDRGQGRLPDRRGRTDRSGVAHLSPQPRTRAGLRFLNRRRMVRLCPASRRLESLGRLSMRLSRSALDHPAQRRRPAGVAPCPRRWPTTTPWTR
jgi:hypothetical protein